ncbi:TauD/TfdA family dioxygenase [Bradyrhizobium sp. WSM3983]|uniref:TauD/TfdA family dioxygenase n=1 Tax=Bradyrhizobium sp. WSM3983 TaxID=1038867 RepID=UPI0018DB2663|nr:TauD/TfdA family dioxygenase [Bradyrhizobium sp. WSM3983]
MNINNLGDRVLRDGWFKSTVTAMGHDMHSAPENIAQLLGNPIAGRSGQKIEPLIPTEQAKANAKSLSVVHGLGAFPMHTDGAHRLQPPRFVVLVCASPGTSPIPTTLIRFRDLQMSASERSRLEAAPFLVRNGRSSFYSTICSRSRPFIRHDAGCMMPQGTESEASGKLIAQRAGEVGFTLVHWRTGDVLVIDNWTVLHGRGLRVSKASSDRKLLRVSVQ